MVIRRLTGRVGLRKRGMEQTDNHKDRETEQTDRQNNNNTNKITTDKNKDVTKQTKQKQTKQQQQNKTKHRRTSKLHIRISRTQARKMRIKVISIKSISADKASKHRLSSLASLKLELGQSSTRPASCELLSPCKSLPP